MQNYQNFDLVSKFQKKLRIFEGLLWKNWRGVWDFGRLLFTLFTTKNSKIAPFSAQPFMVKMGSKFVKVFPLQCFRNVWAQNWKKNQLRCTTYGVKYRLEQKIVFSVVQIHSISGSMLHFVVFKSIPRKDVIQCDCEHPVGTDCVGENVGICIQILCW